MMTKTKEFGWNIEEIVEKLFRNEDFYEDAIDFIVDILGELNFDTKIVYKGRKKVIISISSITRLRENLKLLKILAIAVLLSSYKRITYEMIKMQYYRELLKTGKNEFTLEGTPPKLKVIVSWDEVVFRPLQFGIKEVSIIKWI